MNLLEAIILGIVQGLTEFLPVSSSGHLVLLQHLFGLKEAELVFDVSVHVGTILAVLIFLRREIFAILGSLRDTGALWLKGRINGPIAWQIPEIRLAVLVVVGSIPTGILGLAFHKIAETLFSTVLIVSIDLIITGLLLALTRFFGKWGRKADRMTIRDGLIIGLVQGIAIMPGISRSGSTISAAVFLGIEQETATRFSFLLSIPAVMGAALLSLKGLHQISAEHLGLIAAGTMSAALVGYASLGFLVKIARKGNLHFFAPYCMLVGIAGLIWLR
uniref:Undecaprenyl-diphosphatase n=1 Tax=Desulfatirhabdium butyrativorans TaxID=340467 RepID=A0A7C4MR38_9BACT